MNTYAVCTNEETLFSGEDDKNGDMIQLDLVDLSLRKLREYAWDNDLNVKFDHGFDYWVDYWADYWEGGCYGYKSRGRVRASEEDEHAEKLRDLLAEAVADAVKVYNLQFN